MTDPNHAGRPHLHQRRRSGLYVIISVAAVIIAAGGIFAGLALSRGDVTDSAAAPSLPQESSAPSTVAPSSGDRTRADEAADPGAGSPNDPSGNLSSCGLDGSEITGGLAEAPDAQWEYHGLLAYPVSAIAGPTETAPEGYRYCFQRSPEGALLAAAYAAIAGSSGDSELVGAWVPYALSEGPYRSELLPRLDATATADDEEDAFRAAIAGFRLLAYDGDTARVDIAMVVAVDGQTLHMSGVYELLWANDDWRLNTVFEEPVQVARIPGLTGYVPWSSS